jgi:molecular chaperone DnaK
MSYTLGVDLGTTYTAAAVYRDGRTSTVDLGNRTAVIPSVVFLTEDEAILTGEAANRRGAADPTRLAREFKRRVGDTVPILLGGVPYSADGLMARLLRWVVDTVSAREGQPPAAIGVAHPANWGAFKKDLLGQAIARADLDHAVTITEPEAAVTFYAAQERVEAGSVVAVYDLGGGTFDAAVVRKTPSGVELLGSPEGIERLGGIDFDEAVFAHVSAAVGGALQELDPNDPVAVAAVARLRAECVDAKEALSADTEVSIPVMLPNLNTSVRLTRAEFEAMIRPALADSLVALRRALRSASVQPEQLTSVLLAGGSSRIPLVAQLVGAELGRPVAVDAHPKHGVAMGAALVAAGSGASSAVAAPPPVHAPSPAAPPPPPAPFVSAPAPAPAAAVATAAPAGAAMTSPVASAATSPPAGTARPQSPPTQPLAPTVPAQGPMPAGGSPPRDVPLRPSAKSGGGNGRRTGVIVAAVVLVVAAVAAVGVALASGGDDGGSTADSTTTSPSETTASQQTTTTVAGLGNPCEGVTDRCITIDSIEANADGTYTVEWTANNFTPNDDQPTADEYHAHFFWDTYEATQVGGNRGGDWELTDEQPFTTPATFVAKRGDAAQLCVTVATHEHDIDNPEHFHCVDVPDA